MSNRKAIAAVTAVFSEIIDDAIRNVVSSARVFTLRPGLAVSNGDVGVNVYLYRALPNAGLRNLNQPIRTSDGRLIRRPVAAWDLQYLLTFVGAETSLQPDLLLGAVLTHLEQVSLLGKGYIRNVEETLELDEERRGAAGSGLSDQVELVRLTPIDLSLDSMTQLWSALTNEPFALSVAFQAAAVLMSPEVALSSSLPVGGQPAAALSVGRRPRIHSVFATTGRLDPILIGSTLLIEGSNLRSRSTQVKIGSLTVDVDANAIQDDRIELPLSPDAGSGPEPLSLTPGLLGVQVRHRIDVSSDPSSPSLRPGPSSNVVPIALRPTLVEAVLVSSGDERTIELIVAPIPAPDWECFLLLNRLQGDPPESLVLQAFSIAPGSERLVFEATTVPPGTWLVRVQVNGAESPLQRTDGVFSGPVVEVS